MLYRGMKFLIKKTCNAKFDFSCAVKYPLNFNEYEVFI